MQTETRTGSPRNFAPRAPEFAQRIRAAADRERTVLLAEAERDAQKLRGDGEAQRVKIFGDAVSQDPEFYAFLRSMDAYKRSFHPEDTTMVLTPDSDFFDYFGVAPTQGD